MKHLALSPCWAHHAVSGVLASVLLLLAPFALGQTIRYVDDGGSDTGDCTDEANPCATISYAIELADPADTIDIANGVYTETFGIDKSLFLQGESEEGTIIQAHEEPGEAESRVITMDGGFEVEIADLTIRHGLAMGDDIMDKRGGGIYNGGATLNMSNVIIDNNSAIYGGGLFKMSGSGLFTNVTFSENVASKGGGMQNINGSPTFVDVAFIGNEARSDGIYIGEGGGLYNSLTGEFPTLNGVTFSGNVADAWGGGMYNEEGDPTLTNVTFSGNQAGTGGGMANIHRTSPMPVGVTFSENVATSKDDRIFKANGSPVLTNVTFSENVAISGGGMSNEEGFPVLTNVTFSGNQAEESGGGFYQFHGHSTLSDVSFSGNSALGSSQDKGGGGMVCRGGLYGSSTLSNVTFTENIAAHGGGMHISCRNPVLTNIVFYENVASSSGGGMYILESDLTLINGTFYGNNASGNGGGGVFNFVDASPTLINVTFSYNSAVMGGGILNDSTSSPSLVNSIVWGNLAEDGNEIYNSEGSSIELIYSLYGNGSGDISGEGDVVVENSLTEDPLFADAENGDLRLLEGSPAVDAGDPDTDPLIFPTDENGNPVDLDGNPRFFSDLIDMGAYEWQSSVADEATPDEIADALTIPHPNPVQSISTFRVAVAKGQEVSVEVFDVTGRRMQTLFKGALAAGMAETLEFDASALPAGVYVIRAVGEEFMESRMVVVVK